MSFQIFYEDGHRNAVDEYGRPEPMDYIIDEERYALETVSSHTQYLHNQPQENNFDVDSMADEDAKDDPDVCMKEASNKRTYTLYTDQDKVRFFKLMFEKVMSASAAAKQLGIHVRTAQRWAQMYKADSDSIFIKHKKTGRSRILRDEHKQVILEYIDENPSAVLQQVMERLLQKFQDLKVSKSTVYNFDLLGDLLKIYHDNISSAENDIENILTEVNQKKKLNYNAWATKATFGKEDDEDDDEEDDEDDEVEDGEEKDC
ncbi:unnamed protein product [Rhizopus microsporus]